MKLFFLLLLIFQTTTNASELICTDNKVSSDSPHFPSKKISELIICNQRPENKKLIGYLENLLIHNSFKLPIKKDGATYKLEIGTTGSFSIWRDLINLNLGRAYYESREIKKAISYWERIVPESPYWAMAVIGLNYAYLDLKEYDRVNKLLSQINYQEDDDAIRQEIQLQKALLLLRIGQFAESTEIAKKLNFQIPHLEELRFTILAESLFSKYLSNHTALGFDEKVNTLKLITESLENIPISKRNSNLVYLAAEAYWHTAVAYRIEDPDKYQAIWHKQLEIADSWISPSVDKSIQEGKAQVSEEAFFFSIALLWEREAHEKALVRLKNLDKLYPQGVYREDAYQLLGDYYFDEQKFDLAIPYYRQLAQTGVESKATYGVYKAAWSFYNNKDKWKALRHFERLFQFYVDKKNSGPEEKNELMKESRQDLLLVISEILPSAKGIAELKSFKLSELNTKSMIHDLAKLYQRNGNYQESTLTWNYLLDHHLKDKEALLWLVELANDHFADGKRDMISHQIKQYYPKWKQLHFSADLDKKFGEEWAKIILALHREAKKSEDQLFWKAADLAYEVYEELKPDGQEGAIWYFGAQKFQFQNDIWRSIEWFKRAADVKGYSSADDAALSALGLLNDKSGDLSLIDKKDLLKKEYAKLADYSLWFYKRNSEKLKKQKELASFLYVEAQFFTGEHQKSREFLANIFENPEHNEDAWNVYLAHNKRLYSGKIWNEAYTLSVSLQKTKVGKENDKFNFLAIVAQENAFQMAMGAEKELPINLKSLRSWYEVAYSLPGADDKIKIKAWHNYLLSFNSEEVVPFEKELTQFVQTWEGKTSSEVDLEELFFNIYIKAVKTFETAKLQYKKSKYLYLASQHTSNTQLRESLLWDGIVINANYNEWDEFQFKMNQLKSINSEYLSDSKYLAVIAKYYYLQGKWENSWDILKNQLTSSSVPASSWLLLYDLFEKNSVKASISSFLMANEKKFKLVPWIQPLWARLKKEEYLTSADLSKIEIERLPASSNSEDSEEVKAFKERLARVQSIYKHMNKKKDILKVAIMPEIPATATDAICKAKPLTDEALSSLKELKTEPIKSEQWGQFVSRLEEKEKELHDLAKREFENCEKALDDTVFIGNFYPLPSPFCHNINCFKNKNIMTSEIIGLDNREDEPIDIFISYLYHGAWAKAEAIAAEEKDSKRQSYFYALLRLASDDSWNAYLLLEDLQKSKEWEGKALHLKSIIAMSKNRTLLANKFSPKKDIILTSWERKMFNR